MQYQEQSLNIGLNKNYLSEVCTSVCCYLPARFTVVLLTLSLH